MGKEKVVGVDTYLPPPPTNRWLTYCDPIITNRDVRVVGGNKRVWGWWGGGGGRVMGERRW